jgi:hypothetical protein
MVAGHPVAIPRADSIWGGLQAPMIKAIKLLLRLVVLIAAAAALISGMGVGLTVVSAEGTHHAVTARQDDLPEPVIQPDRPSTVYAADGKTVLAVFQDTELREPVPLGQVAKVGLTAVIDTEDHRFYQHGGIDVRSLLRAGLNDTSGSGLQGGSTIAQQLVKQLFLNFRAHAIPEGQGGRSGRPPGAPLHQESDRAGLPQHHLTGPRGVRNRGRGSNVLPGARQQAHPRPGRPPGRHDPEPQRLRSAPSA